MKRRVAAALIVAVVAAGGVVATFAVAFATGSGRRADAKVFAYVGRRDAPKLRELAHRIGGDTVNAAAAAGAVVVSVVLALLSVARKTRLSGWAVALLVGGAFLTTETLKSALADEGHELAPLHRPALFPSGHATVAMAVVLAAVLSAPARRRALTTLVGTLVAAALGVLIVVGHLHPPSDVIGGFLVSATWAALLAPFARADDVGAVSERRSTVLVPLGALALSAIVFLVAANVVGDARFLVALVAALGGVATVIVAAIGLLADAPRWRRAQGGQDPLSAYVE